MIKELAILPKILNGSINILFSFKLTEGHWFVLNVKVPASVIRNYFVFGAKNLIKYLF